VKPEVTNGLSKFFGLNGIEEHGAPGVIQTRDPLLRSRLSTFIKTCRSERRAGQQVVATSDQLLAPSSSSLSRRFAAVCRNSYYAFYDGRSCVGRHCHLDTSERLNPREPGAQCPSPCTLHPAESPTGSVTPKASRRFVEDHEGIESIQTLPASHKREHFPNIKGSLSLLR